MHVAATYGRIEAIRLLLSYGADPNIVDEVRYFFPRVYSQLHVHISFNLHLAEENNKLLWCQTFMVLKRALIRRVL